MDFNHEAFLAFHSVLPPGAANFLHPLTCSYGRFWKIINRLVAEGYFFRRASDLSADFRSGLMSRSGQKSAMLAFHDGHKDGLSVAQCLYSIGVKATFFPIASVLGGKVPPNRILSLVLDKEGDEVVKSWLLLHLGNSPHYQFAEQFLANEALFEGPFSMETLVGRLKNLWNFQLPIPVVMELSEALAATYLKDFDQKAFLSATYLSAADLRKMVELKMEIGSHSYNHLGLANQARPNVLSEVKRSLAQFQLEGIDVRSFCPPYGGRTVSEDLLSVQEATSLTWLNYQEHQNPKDGALLSIGGAGYFDHVDHHFFEV